MSAHDCSVDGLPYCIVLECYFAICRADASAVRLDVVQKQVTNVVPVHLIQIQGVWRSHPELFPSASVVSRTVNIFLFSALSSSLTISDVT